jgi:regulation of enolase protein 1 (concanavalin A-like superfamily)
MKALSLAIQKILPMLKFLKLGSNFKVKVTRSKTLAPIERSCYKNTHMNYESPITCHSKDIANVKVLKSGSNFKVKVTMSKTLVLIEMSFYKEHTYEICKPYHLPFKRYGQC